MFNTNENTTKKHTLSLSLLINCFSFLIEGCFFLLDLLPRIALHGLEGLVDGCSRRACICEDLCLLCYVFNTQTIAQ